MTYTIPTKVPDQLLPGKDRMLATIVPQGEKAWFVKVMGPESAVKLIENDLREFVSTIKFDGGKPNLKKLPDGWRRGGEKPMRFASIDVETPTKQLDISISNLTRPDGDEEAWDKYVTMNVNRWRGQVGLESSEEKWAGGEPIKITAADGPSVWVDLIGEASASSSMSAPFAGNAPFAGKGPFAGGTKSSPTPEQSSGGGGGKSKLDFDRPEGWRDGRMSSMRMAAFNVGPVDSEAEVTVIAAGGDLRGNVARWIGQVRGGTPEDDVVDAALEAAEKLKVSGQDAQRFVLTGEDATTGKAIDATIVPMDEGFNMFIKMTGPAATVIEQGDALGAFLKSLKF